MKKVSLALIGDIHYPDNHTSARFIDQKDQGITSRITSRLAPDRLKVVSDTLRRTLSRDTSIQAVLLCGDLTSRGDMGSYAKCLQYLENILDLSNEEYWNERHLHVVPGNHDITRSSIDINDANIYKKFEPITDAWKKIGRTEMQPDTVRKSDARVGSSIARILSVNTCVGCGEHRYLDPGIRRALLEVLSNYAEKETPDNAFELIGEQIDTPAIDEAHITKIDQLISEIQPMSSIPVLLAHHGILPQAIPRVQIYSELLNSGRVRFALANHKRPILYCHGHLHEDPIEIVTQPQEGAGKIIVISAPLFSDGFNLINLIFNNDGRPLGCEILKYRFENGSVVEKEPARIPLVSNLLGMEEDSLLRKVLNITSAAAQRFGKILELARPSITRIGEKSLSDNLLELEWMGLIEIKNRSGEFRHWQIRRIAP